MDDRVSETRGTLTRRYLYDASGRILGEYGASATDVIAEHLWLSPDAANDNMPFGGEDGVSGYAPLAISSAPTGGTAQIVWVHGNHMGVPLVYTNTTGASITPPAFTQSAFPGQMKTLPDLYYNRYRDYDPTTGRYIQADPIGLNGDPNPYAYAMNNPLKYSDSQGLFTDIIIRLIRDNIARQIGDAATKATNSMLDDIFPSKTQCPVPSGDNDDECEQQYERDIGRCTSARIKYGREGFKLCASSALRRKEQCKRRFTLEPLTGVDRPLDRPSYRK